MKLFHFIFSFLIILNLLNLVYAAGFFPCHPSKASANSEVKCSRVVLPSGLCRRCPLRPTLLDGSFEQCSRIYDTSSSDCRTAIGEYVDLNPCDTARKSSYDRMMKDDESGETELDYFLYSVCEQCCDCIPMGTKKSEYSKLVVSHSSSNPSLWKEDRGNCPAHAQYDVCKVLPHVTYFSKPNGPEISAPQACPILRKWQNSEDSTEWQLNPQAEINQNIETFLRGLLNAVDCSDKQIWSQCYDMENKQNHLEITEEFANVEDDDDEEKEQDENTQGTLSPSTSIPTTTTTTITTTTTTATTTATTTVSTTTTATTTIPTTTTATTTTTTTETTTMATTPSATTTTTTIVPTVETTIPIATSETIVEPSPTVTAISESQNLTPTPVSNILPSPTLVTDSSDETPATSATNNDPTNEPTIVSPDQSTSTEPSSTESSSTEPSTTDPSSTKPSSTEPATSQSSDDTPSDTSFGAEGDDSPDSDSDATSSSDTTSETSPGDTGEGPSSNSDSLASNNGGSLSTATCFPADATVQLKSGKSISMRDLKIGDVVRVSENSFSEVYLFSHRMPTATSLFVRITTNIGTLKLTPGHYLEMNGKLSPASTVSIGDVVRTTSGMRNVTATSFVEDYGLYNPHTVDGSIVVNEIITSTFTTAIESRTATSLLTPFRALYALGILTEKNAGLLGHQGFHHLSLW